MVTILDGMGAVVLEAAATGSGDAAGAGSHDAGILGSISRTYAVEESRYITLGESYRPPAGCGERYLKTQGRKVYEFALRTVPAAMKTCLASCGIELDQLKKIFLHQANEKMDADLCLL